jgi:hypothetical protein
MEKDIVERLRTAANNNRYQAEAKRDTSGHALDDAQVVGKNAVAQMHDEAADEIERLRNALRGIAHDSWHAPVIDSPAANEYAQIVSEMMSRARDALA